MKFGNLLGMDRTCSIALLWQRSISGCLSKYILNPTKWTKVARLIVVRRFDGRTMESHEGLNEAA
jgi:hypothetical protein